MLRCKLTEDELRTKSRSLVNALTERNQQEQEIESEKADFKDRLKQLKKDLDEKDSDVVRLANDLRTQTEERPVECIETKDERRQQISVIRTDTGEVVSTRPFSARDRQEELPLGEPEDEGDEDASAEEAPADEAKAPETAEGKDGQPLVQVPKGRRRGRKAKAAADADTPFEEASP